MHPSNKLQVLFITFILSLFPIFLIIAVHSSDGKINDSNIDYIRSFGWQPEQHPDEISRINIPAEFDEVYTSYNAVSAAAGFDLTPYKGVKAVRYSYKILNHSASSTGLIRANLFLYKNKIVSADIASLEIDGFVQPINDKTGQINTATVQ